MAVVWVREVVGRGGNREVNSRKRYTRVFQVITDDPSDGTKVVRDDPTLPDYGDPWVQLDANDVQTDIDTDAFCVEKRATQTDENNPQNWVCICEYVGLGDPTAEPPRVHWTGEKYQKASQTDATGTLVANSAGDPYSSGMTRDRHRSILIIERNILTWDPDWPDTYLDTLNLFAILTDRHPPGGKAAATCKMDELDAEPVYYSNYPVSTDIHYWRQKIKISIDPEGWLEDILDAGFHQLVPRLVGSPLRIKIIDPAGGYPSTPRPLDGSGHALAVGGSPVYRSFVKHETADWTELNITY
jgi:hypothetical protein